MASRNSMIFVLFRYHYDSLRKAHAYKLFFMNKIGGSAYSLQELKLLRCHFNWILSNKNNWFLSFRLPFIDFLANWRSVGFSSVSLHFSILRPNNIILLIIYGLLFCYSEIESNLKKFLNVSIWQKKDYCILVFQIFISRW